METLDPHDMAWCRRLLPAPVVEIMKEAGPALICAGGFIRSAVQNEVPADVDLFTTSRAAAEHWATKMAALAGLKQVKTDNAITLKGRELRFPVQIIHRWTFSKPSDVIESFDFTIARALFWWQPIADAPNLSRWFTQCDPRFYSDLAGKRLVYCSPQRNEDAGGSMLRILKFYPRGFRIPLDSLGAVMARLLAGVHQENAEFWRAWHDATVEAYRSKILTGVLREVDPNVDPDRIFHLSGGLPENETGGL